MQAIVAGDYAFEPEVYWAGVSDAARDFINCLLTVDPSKRMTASQALEHPWLATDAAKNEGQQKDLLPDLRSNFNAKRTFRKAVHGIRLINRLRSETSDGGGAKQEIEALRRRIVESEEQESADEVLDVPSGDHQPASGEQVRV